MEWIVNLLARAFVCILVIVITKVISFFICRYFEIFILWMIVSLFIDYLIIKCLIKSWEKDDKAADDKANAFWASIDH